VENRIGETILGCALEPHKAFGPGLLESAYEAWLAYEPGKRKLSFARQTTLPARYDGVELDAGYRLELLVERSVVVEIKAVDTITDVHRRRS
jgi:GxxExxY protein